MQTTLRHLDRIDVVTFDPVTKEYALIISAFDDWDETVEEENLLIQKINNYLNYIINGEIFLHYPEFKGQKSRIQIDTKPSLPTSIDHLCAEVQKLLLKNNINLCVNLVSQQPS